MENAENRHRGWVGRMLGLLGTALWSNTLHPLHIPVFNPDLLPEDDNIVGVRESAAPLVASFLSSYHQNCTTKRIRSHDTWLHVQYAHDELFQALQKILERRKANPSLAMIAPEHVSRSIIKYVLGSEPRFYASAHRFDIREYYGLLDTMYDTICLLAINGGRKVRPVEIAQFFTRELDAVNATKAGTIPERDKYLVVGSYALINSELPGIAMRMHANTSNLETLIATISELIHRDQDDKFAPATLLASIQEGMEHERNADAALVLTLSGGLHTQFNRYLLSIGVEWQAPELVVEE